ncbi:hypothetical protein [Armatimonas sp.]|uniref:hypothetical protein n=1 Tax=Armatimonas sp. TaxID=1872638 RepID=UPI003750C052
METLLPVALLLVLGGFGALVVRSVKRRKAFLSTVTSDSAELPDLRTELRLTGTLRRLWRDPQEGLPLAELGVGSQRFVFCTTDQAIHGERYKAAIGKTIEVALYGLATLAPGGVEAMQEQLRDADKVPPDTVTLVHEGQLENDYVVIGRLLSQRSDTWGELPLAVYRAQVLHTSELTLVLELAVPSPQDAAPLPANSLAHGSVRLFGYLPS